MKKFSIVVPINNCERYIKRCLDSIKMQTYTNIEVILIDDGSNDNSGKICDEYMKNDSRFIVHHQTNGGVSTARNKGIDFASGDYLMFVDSDDWISKETIELLNKKIEENNSDVLIFQRSSCKQENQKAVINDRKNISKKLKQLIITEKINPPFCKLYRTDIIKGNNIRFKKDIPIAEDLLFNVTYFSKINSMEITDERYYFYNTDNQSSLSRRYNPQKYEQLMQIDDKLQEIIKSVGELKLYNVIKYIRIKNIFSCIIDLNRDECTMTKNEKKLFVKRAHKENKIGIILDCGVRPFVYSCVYNIFRSTKILLFLAKYAR